MPNRVRSRFALASAALALTAALASPVAAQQAVGDTGAAVNQGSAVTEKILSELRASKTGEDDSANDASKPADGAPAASDADAAAQGPPQDGSLAEPPANTPNPDGLLRDSAGSAPADGDLSADGKLVTPAEAPSTDAPDAEPVQPVAPAAAVTTMAQPDARTVAGRPRPVAEDDGPAPKRSPAEPAADSAGQDDAADDAVLPPAQLRPQVTETDDNPYAPVGYRLGGFRLLPTITAETVYSNNVRQSASNRQSDVALALRPGFNLESQWSRHFVSLDVNGLTTSHARLSSEDDRQLSAKLRGRFDITADTAIEGEAAYDFGQLSRSNPDVPFGASIRPSTRTTTFGGAFDQRFNRLSLRLHGSVADTDQGDAGNGGEHYRDGSADLRAGYELSPSLTVFGTAKAIDRRYGDASGIDASGDDARIGLETDRSAKLSGAFSVGAANISARDDAVPSLGGLVADANVIWLPSALTTLTFAASSDIELTDVTGAVAMRNSTVSLELRHEFRRWLALLAGFSEAKRTYAGLDLTENQLSGRVGMEYDLNRTWAVVGDYEHTDFTSSDPGRGFTEDQVRLGVRVQR